MIQAKPLVACLALLATALGCKPATTTDSPPAAAPTNDGSYKIVATTGMVADIVRHVAGDKATVEGLMGEGVDPHLYKPTRGDVKRLTEADVIFYSGLLLEGRMADQFTKLARSGKPVFAVTERLSEESDEVLIYPADDEAHADPHLWMDVSLWSQCVTQVADALAEFDTANADYYHANAKAYQEQLAELHEYTKRAIASIPDDQRVLITAHDAFGYFSRAYDIPVMSIQGISTESEAGVDDINRLVDAIVNQKIGAMFVESSVSAKNIQAVIEGCADRGWKVTIGGELFSDAMGTPGTYEGTYIGMIDHNATVIASGLGGVVEAGGMQGKLATSNQTLATTE